MDGGTEPIDGEAPALETATPNAVLDTNVCLAIYSWHDVLTEGQEVLHLDPTADLTHPKIQFRAQRARSAFLLALFLNERRWMTVAPWHELRRTLEKNVPPDDLGAGHKSNFTRFLIHFVKGKLLPAWVTGTDVAADE